MICPTCKKDFEKGVKAAYELGLLARRRGLITESVHHRTISGVELVEMREAVGISQAAFAEKCGWSQPFQSQLESPKLHEIPTSTAEKIIAVFAEYNQSLI